MKRWMKKIQKNKKTQFQKIISTLKISTIEEHWEKFHDIFYKSKTKEEDRYNKNLLQRLSISHYYEAVYDKKLQDD